MTTGSTEDVFDPKSSKHTVRVIAGSGVPAHARRILAADPSLTFIQCYGNTEQAFRVAQELTPCVLILTEEGIADLQASSIAMFFKKGVRTIVLLTSCDDRKITHLLRMGYSGVLNALDKTRKLRKAVQAVASGQIWASRGVLSDLVRESAFSTTPQKLTPRETEILALISQGRKNNEIAQHLFVTRDTVRWHERRLYSKLGVRGRSDIVQRS